MTRAKKFVRCACGQETGLRRWSNEGWLRMEVEFSDGSRKLKFTCPTCRARNVDQTTPAPVPPPTGSAWISASSQLPAMGDTIACAAEHRDGGMMFWAGTVTQILRESFAVMETRGERSHSFVITRDTLWMRLPDLPNATGSATAGSAPRP